MTERSRFWNSTGPGDASEAPYDAPTEFAQVMAALGGGHAYGGYGGVWPTGLHLKPSSPGANTVRIPTGSAHVYGTWYETDANIDVNVPTPAGATRVDLIVLRKSWAGQTVRVTRVAGTEGAGTPSVTRVVGTTWDVLLCIVSITTGGVITIDDRRQLLVTTGYLVGYEFPLPDGTSRRVLADDAVFGGKLMVLTDAGSYGEFFIRGGVNDALLVHDVPANSFTATLGTGSRINVDWNATEYQIQNNSGAERLIRVFLIRGF